jgi:alpha-amylase
MVRTLSGGAIRKVVSVDPKRPALDCRYSLEGVEVPVIGLEFNLSLRDEQYLRTPGEQLQASRFRIEEPSIGVSLSVSIDPPATLIHFPIETVSESEEGLERTYQGLGLVCLWQMAGARFWTGRLTWTVEAS